MRTTVFPIRAWLLAIAAVFQMAAAGAATLPASGCSPTAAHGSGFASLPVSSAGYRVISVRWDPLLKQRWAVVSPCDHSERPSFTVPIADHNIPQRVLKTLFPVVHSGDTVRLVSTEPLLRITISAIAEENGVVGSTVRIRLLRPIASVGDDPSSLARPVIMQAVVRGPHEVETER